MRPLRFFAPFAALLVVAALALPASAQNKGTADEPLLFSYLDGDDGLPQSFVSALAQDSLGFLWVGTIGGLARYDGRDFEVFRPNPDDSTTIPGLAIRGIHTARDGSVWVGTNRRGLSRYDYATGTFERIAPPEGAIQDYFNNVMSLAEQPDGTIWVASHGGVAWFDDEARELRLLPSPFSNGARLAVLGLYATPGGIWMSDEGGRLLY
jgi:ligand-binding sensor domain-containing protein